VPYFVPHLNQELSQTVADERERKSPLLARRINTIVKHRTVSQLSLDGLLISGLQVRVLPGSPLFSITRNSSSLSLIILGLWAEAQSCRLVAESGPSTHATSVPGIKW
jgi:hypothetical protein